jgi:hypothetical protein
LELSKILIINVWLFDDIKYKYELRPINFIPIKSWKKTFKEYNSKLTIINEKLNKLNLLFKLIAKHPYATYHFFFLTGSCIAKFSDKMKFFKGIFEKDFYLQRPYNPGPCECLVLNHDNNLIEKRRTISKKELKQFMKNVVEHQ